jgi:hypothetical protein
MVPHQTICPYFQFVFIAVSFEGIQIEPAILIIEKDGYAVIAALGYVVGIIDSY